MVTSASTESATVSAETSASGDVPVCQPGVVQVEVMIGNEYPAATVPGTGDTSHTRNAIVDGDDPVDRLPILSCDGMLDECGRQSVAEGEPVRNKKIDIGAKASEPPDGNRASGGSVGIVVGDHQKPFPFLDGLGDRMRCLTDMRHTVGRNQTVQGSIDLVDACDVTTGVHTRKNRMDAGVAQPFECLGANRSLVYPLVVRSGHEGEYGKLGPCCPMSS